MILAVATALALSMSVDFDPATTKINWTLEGNVHTVHGTFQLKQGHVEIADGKIATTARATSA